MKQNCRTGSLPFMMLFKKTMITIDCFFVLFFASYDAVLIDNYYYWLLFYPFQNDCGYYKNLLQELAQNEGFMLPTYKTTKSGPPHKPRFFSTVEVEGETFHGIQGSSKKQAEINAAKVAYNGFMERTSCSSPSMHVILTLIYCVQYVFMRDMISFSFYHRHCVD